MEYFSFDHFGPDRRRQGHGGRGGHGPSPFGPHHHRHHLPPPFGPHHRHWPPHFGPDSGRGRGGWGPHGHGGHRFPPFGPFGPHGGRGFGPHGRGWGPEDDEDYSSSSDDEDFRPQKREEESSSDSTSSDSDSSSDSEVDCHKKGGKGKRHRRHGKHGCPHHHRRHHGRHGHCWPPHHGGKGRHGRWPPHHHHHGRHGRGPWEDEDVQVEDASNFGSDYQVIQDDNVNAMNNLQLDDGAPEDQGKRQKKTFKVALNADGFKTKDIRIRRHQNTLLVEGKQDSKTFLGSFQRSFAYTIRIPEGVNPKKLKTKLGPDGVLRIKAKKPKKSPREDTDADDVEEIPIQE